MLRNTTALGERFYSHLSLGDRGPSKSMKPARGDVLTWMRREDARMEPEDDGVGVPEKRRSKSRRRKDNVSTKECHFWSREAAGKPGVLLMEASIERAGGDPSQNESRAGTESYPSGAVGKGLRAREAPRSAS